MKHIMNVTTPIIKNGPMISISRKAKLRLTANASILVAIDSIIKTLKSSGLNDSSLDSCFKDS